MAIKNIDEFRAFGPTFLQHETGARRSYRRVSRFTFTTVVYYARGKHFVIRRVVISRIDFNQMFSSTRDDNTSINIV